MYLHVYIRIYNVFIAASRSVYGCFKITANVTETRGHISRKKGEPESAGARARASESVSQSPSRSLLQNDIMYDFEGPLMVFNCF